MTQQVTKKRKAKHRRSQEEMRASFLLPIAIGLAILFAGILVALIAPWSFNSSITIIIGLGLLIYLIWSTRKAPWRLRILAIIFAIPAIVGIALGLSKGNITDPLIGIGITVALLALQRVLSTPLSYRAANRRFQAGDMENALNLINKSLAARPDYWESYQLRSLIHLSSGSYAHAERDAQKALTLRPDAHPVYNTLGQLYLAQERFADAEEAYIAALDLAPHYTLYLYHLGLCEYRQEKYAEAVESFTEATNGTLPYVSYDLQNYYYLVCSLEGLGDLDDAKKAEAEMAQFKDGLRPLQQQLRNQPDFPHLARLKADLADLEKRLSAYEENNA